MTLILEAARLAPSAENTQPWRFVILRETASIHEFAQQCFSGLFAATRFAGEAAALIALCADRAKFLERAGEMVLRTALYQLDCGIAGEHLVLAASDLGIGSCWIGWFNKRKARRLLGLPPRVEIVAMIALGYAKEGIARREKVRRPLSQIARLERWNGGKPYGADTKELTSFPEGS